MKPKIAPSILAANFNYLEKDILMINDSEADFIHCDIMDGVFVPNISFGIPVVEHVK
jgi:ribulose-phosphate 3-epimerase